MAGQTYLSQFILLAICMPFFFDPYSNIIIGPILGGQVT